MIGLVEFESEIDDQQARLARTLVTWLESGDRLEPMFAAEVFADLSLPQWRLQAQGPDATFRLREDSHPCHGEVRVEGLNRTSRGFLLQFEERWQTVGQHWYCRELIHCVVTDGLISELIVYCTGDWDEAVQQRHAAEVHLPRP